MHNTELLHIVGTIPEKYIGGKRKREVSNRSSKGKEKRIELGRKPTNGHDGIEAGQSRRRPSDIEPQMLQETEILDQELTGVGTRQNLLINCSLYSPKIIVRFNGLSPLNNSLKRVLVVAPKQPQCRF